MNEEQGLTIGQSLRQERERKNLSLESVAKVTRITLENLEALERDDFSAISAPVFVRGFLRNYAAHLGLDPKGLMARYDSQVNLLTVSPKMKEPPPVSEGSPLRKYLLFLMVILIGVGVGFYFLPKGPVPPLPSPPSAAIPPPPRPLIQPPPSQTLSPPGKASPEAIPPEKGKKLPEKLLAAAPITKDEEKPKERRHVLKVIATEKTWLRIKSDDQTVVDVLLQAKETASWSARRRFDVSVGNAGGIEIFFNGVSQGPLGKSGEVINLVFPKEIQPSKTMIPKETEPGTDIVPKETMPSKDPLAVETKPSQDMPAKEPKTSAEEKESMKNLR